MKINKLFLGLLGMATMTFTACSSDDDYEMATVSGQQVYFSSEMEDIFEIDLSSNVTNLPVYRVNAEGAYTAQIDVVQVENSKFTIPTSVTFEDGKTVAMLPISYNAEEIEPGSYEDLTLTLTDEANVTSFGASTYTCKLGAAAWDEWGPFTYTKADGTVVKANTCTYTYNNYYAGDDVELPFMMRHNAVSPNLYQFKVGNPDIPNKGWASGVTLILDYDSETGRVTCAPQFAASNATYGNVTVADSWYYWVTVRNTDLSKMSEDDYGHVDFENGYIYIPMAWYVSAGSFGYNVETITIDGYDRADLSAVAEYAGKFIDSEDNYSIVLNVALGEDVSKAIVALVLGEPTEEYLAAIAEGTYQPSQEITESGEVRFDASELEDGDYTIVVVPFLERDALDPVFSNFTFTTAAKETWTLVGTGDYTYSIFFTDENDQPAVDPGLELYQSNDDPTRFKITHWGYDVDFIFTWDGNTTVNVPQNFTGYTHSTYGDVMVQEAADWKPSSFGAYASQYDAAESTFSFCVGYFVEAGGFGAGFETFKVTWGTASRVMNALAKSKQIKNLQLQPYNRYMEMLTAKSVKQLNANLKLK